MPTYQELRETLNKEQADALKRIFDAKGKAFGADLEIPAPYILDAMNPNAASRLIAEAAFEVIQEDVAEAKQAFIDAGENFAIAAKARREELEDAMFGELQKLPLMDRVAISKEPADHLLKLLGQARDSNDWELANLVFLASHVSDLPEVREQYFKMNPEAEEYYHEWVEIPDDEQLAGYAEGERFEQITASRSLELEDIVHDARNQLLVLTGKA